MSHTRRQFLQHGAALLAASAGCDRVKEKPTESSPSHPAQASAGDERPADKEAPVLEPQRGAGPLAFAGDRLAQLRPDALVVRHAADGAGVVTIPLDGGRGVGVLGDGSLVAVEQSDALKGMTRFVRLAPKATKPERFTGPFSYARDRLAHVFPGSEPDTAILVPPGKTAEVAKLIAPDQARPARQIELDTSGPSVIGQLPDRALVHYAARDRAFVRTPPGKAFPFRIDGTAPDHVAAAGPDRIWATGSGALHLLALADPITTITKVDAGGSIYHLAAAPNQHAAVLVPSGDRKQASLTWTLVAFDATGKQAWSVAVDLPGSTPRWVVASDTHVAVGDATAVLVFAAADGMRRYRA